MFLYYYLFCDDCDRPLRGVDSVHFQLLLMACVDYVVHGLSLAIITGR